MNRTIWVIVGVIIVAGVVVGLVLASRDTGQSGPSIQGSTWEWVSMRETAPASQSVVPDPTRYTITFNNDGTFAAKVDCNQVSGTYTASEGQISIVSGPSTMAECGPESLYNIFLAKLATVDGYNLQGDQLTLAFGAGAGELMFKSR